MAQEPSSKPDYRLPTAAKWAAPRAVADGSGGTIIAVAEIPAYPERVYQALTTDEVERWWGHLITTARLIGKQTCVSAGSGAPSSGSRMAAQMAVAASLPRSPHRTSWS